MIDVTVLSGHIPLYEIIRALLKEGIVVLETTRHDAKLLTTKTADAIGIENESEEGFQLINLSTNVASVGFSDFLIYTKIFNHNTLAQELVRIQEP